MWDWISFCCCCSGIQALFFSVRMVSGAMQLARMPWGPTWAARSWVSSWTPAFAAPYATSVWALARRILSASDNTSLREAAIAEIWCEVFEGLIYLQPGRRDLCIG